MKIFKNSILLILLVLISACGSSKSSSQQNSPAVTDIFNVKTYNISTGDTVKLNYREVDTAAGAVVSFVSNNLNIVQVNNSGEITGISAGTAQVEIVVTTLGITQKDVCTVNVKDDFITYLGYAYKEQILSVNETVTPKLIILPESLKDNTITYDLKDYGGIVNVDINGAVTGLKSGSTVLTAKAGKLSTSINITVKESIIHVTDISLTETSAVILQGESYKIIPVISPDNADNKNVIYSSSNKNVAVVLPDGTVTGENPGTAVITVETVDGAKTAELNITVQESVSPLESIMIDNVILESGTSQFINVQTTPVNAKYSGLNIVTYNDSVTITPVTRNTLLVSAKKQGYLTNVEVEALDCGKSPLDCTAKFDTFTIDNETAKLPETLVTVEPYNIIQSDATNYKIKLAFDSNNKLYPLSAVKKYPENSKVAVDEWDILLPANSEGNQILVKNSDNSVSAQGTGSAVISVGILGHSEIKPVVFDVEVVANGNQIEAVDKHCEISSIEVTDESGLISRLSKIGTLEQINANIMYNSNSNCGIRIPDYSIETSDKNIIDIIDGYAYSKKAGTATLTIIPNTIFSNNITKEIQITVE